MSELLRINVDIFLNYRDYSVKLFNSLYRHTFIVNLPPFVYIGFTGHLAFFHLDLPGVLMEWMLIYLSIVIILLSNW